MTSVAEEDFSQNQQNSYNNQQPAEVKREISGPS